MARPSVSPSTPPPKPMPAMYLPAHVLERLQTAWRSAEQTRLQYEALATVAVEALGYDTRTQQVHVDLETGAITLVEQNGHGDGLTRTLD
jgi:hypothetical protein